MTISLLPNEKLIREGHANLQCGVETIGGELFLTNQRLFFQAHPLNFQSGPTQIELSDVSGTQLCRTKLLGFIPLAQNSLAVQTASGKEFRFVISGRKEWATAIAGQTDASRA